MSRVSVWYVWPLLLCFGVVVSDGAEPPAAKAQGEQEARTVTVTAEGYDRDDAIKQALRKALEQGAGTQLAGFSKVENFALVRDTIYARAIGIVREYDIIEERAGAGGSVIVTVRATVRPSAVAETWGEVQNLLDQIGRPKIMVFVDERIDGEPQRESVVESRIEQLFVKAGFELVESKAIEAIRQRASKVAELEGDEGKLRRLAGEAGAQIYIRGAANANQAGLEAPYGVSAAFYNCDVQAKVYTSDTGQLLASESIPSTRRGVRSRNAYSPQAAREALVQATFPRDDVPFRQEALATELFAAVMEQWSTQITAGGEIVLEVESLAFKAYLELKRALEALDRIKSVHGEFTDGTGTYRIRATVSAEQLAGRLTEKPFSEVLEVRDLKLHRIRCRAKVHDR